MMRWIVGIFLLLLVFGGILLFGLGIFPSRQQRPAVTEVSPEAAASAEMKLAALDNGEEVRLSGIELTSLFRYRPEIWSAGAVTSPAIQMSGDTLWLTGAIPTDRLPSQPEIDAIRFFLPDTAWVELAGHVRPMPGGVTVLDVSSIDLAGMPIPPRYIPVIADRMGHEQRADLPPTSIILPLPGGVGSARVEGGELILTP
jgi:hypothetical protein